MNTTEQILLAVLASALAVFLILAIVAAVFVIRLVKNLQAIAQKAESLVTSAESAAEMVRNTIGHLSVLKFVKSVVDMVHTNTKKGR